MESIIAAYEFISDVTDEIEHLIEKSKLTTDNLHKKELLEKSRTLIVAYEKHIGRKVFNKI